MIRTILIDQYQLIRIGFRMMLNQATDIDIIAEFSCAEDGLNYVRKHPVDLVIVDIHLPGMSGLGFTEKVARSCTKTKILVVASDTQIHYARRFLKAGANGYLTRECNQAQLLSAIRQVALGRHYLCTDIARSMAMSMLAANASPFDRLSNREFEVAIMLVKGYSLGEIGERLKLSPKTISTYKQRVLEKLNVRHVVQVAYLMMTYGLLDGEGNIIEDENDMQERLDADEELENETEDESNKDDFVDS